MPPSLTLTARADNRDSVPDGDGQNLMVAKLPAEVALTVVSETALTRDKVTVSRDGDAVDVTFETPPDDTTSATTFKGTFQAPKDTGYGTYIVAAEGVTGMTLTIAKSQTVADNPDGGEEKDGVLTEVSPGELSTPFLISTGVFTALLVLLILGGAAALLSWRLKFKGSYERVPVTEWVSGSNAETMAGVTQLIAVAAGAVLVIVGGWLAALEVRGRLRRQLTTTVTGQAATSRGVATEAGDAAAKVIEALKSSRGTIAVLSVGAILILGSLFAAAQVAGDSHGPAAPATPSPTTQPTGSPSAGEPTTMPGTGTPEGPPSDSANVPESPTPTEMPSETPSASDDAG